LIGFVSDVENLSNFKKNMMLTSNIGCKFRCILCPRVSGITKKIGAFLWAHLTCVNNIGDISFESK
jgi:hypothetical protein